jgi:hypothetical protein
MLAAGYLVVLAAVAAIVHGLLRHDGRQPQPSDWVWAIASGLLWPLLVVGAIQAAVIWFAVERLRRRRSSTGAESAMIGEDILVK